MSGEVSEETMKLAMTMRLVMTMINWLVRATMKTIEDKDDDDYDEYVDA